MKIATVLLFSIFTSITSFAQSHSHSHSQSHDMSWRIVPNETVCMVTEAHFDKPQIPVKVGGKTYYGCCDGCKKTLTENQGARSAVDPLTKKTVDKATATIAANKEGKVLYFESKTNFEKYINLHHSEMKH